MKLDNFRKDVDIGLVGEIDARRELAAEGWLTINTNTEKGNFPNVDLIAAKGEEARGIQVKTTNAEVGSHCHCLYLGRAEAWLTANTSFFNSKLGPIKASVVVLVHAKRRASRFVVFPIGVAEKIARLSVERWYEVPKRDGNRRSAGFDARLPFTRLPKNPTDMVVFCQETLLKFENRWDVLSASIIELNDPYTWDVEFSQFETTSSAFTQTAM